VCQPGEGIKSVMSGTVLLSAWTIETGYLLVIQHPNNLVSVYKHNAELLKQTGNMVKAGEVIAIVGNSGEYTSGPHLHFELWHNGIPVNPEDYILF
jgi:murein DD-endopeptidase MepM/ murein hydrolase activator NlpD